MKGRIYDPVLAEFLSPDPVMQRPTGYSLNAFSYVFNQPLDYVDPSGFVPWDVGNYDLDANGKNPIFMDDLLKRTPPASGGSGITPGLPQGSMGTEATAASGSGVSPAEGGGSLISIGTSAYNFARHSTNPVTRQPVKPRSVTAPGAGAHAAAKAPATPAQPIGLEPAPAASNPVHEGPSDQYPFGKAESFADVSQQPTQFDGGVPNGVLNDREFIVPDTSEAWTEELAMVPLNLLPGAGPALIRRLAPALKELAREGGLFLRASRAGYRLHGGIPNREVLRRMGKEALVELRELTRTSIATREAEILRLGAKGGHGPRLGQERRLLDTLTEVLTGKGVPP